MKEEEIEIWKEAFGYEGILEVSNKGNIKRLPFIYKRKFRDGRISCTEREGQIYKLGNMTSGYLFAHVFINGKGKNVSAHRLAALTFIPNPLNKPQINHINGIKTDNRIENLEWCTRSENQRHNYDVLNIKGANTGKFNNWCSKKVAQYNLNNEFIQEFPSLSQAAFEMKGERRDGGIRDVCRGVQKTAYGYKWKYI